jgi:hypothetical protein
MLHRQTMIVMSSTQLGYTTLIVLKTPDLLRFCRREAVAACAEIALAQNGPLGFMRRSARWA